MAKKLTPHVRQKLIEVGDALDIDEQLAVGLGGEVSIHEDDERSENAERECEEPSGGQGSQRRAGQGQGARQTGPGTSPRFGRGGVLAHYLEGQAAVEERYDADFHLTENGLWVVTPSAPLGVDGPQFTLAVFLTANPIGRPPVLAWGIAKMGDFPKFVGPRHTNFPFHDICAQGPDGEAWSVVDGVRPLLNLYSTWLFRHCFLAEFGRWPGRQWGATALYRRTEFSSEEWCGCGSAARYGDCCMESDFALSSEDAEEDHVRTMGSAYCRRQPPIAVKAFARSNWQKVPVHPFIGDKRFKG